MERLYIGVDPGAVNGAAVAIARVDGRWRIAWQHAWASRADAMALPAFPPGIVGAAVEAVFVGPARQGAIGLAENAGMWAALLGAQCPVLRPSASQWRPAVLGLGARARAATADARAREVVGLVVDGTPASGHAVDAVCLALYAAGVRCKAAGGRRRR